MVSALSARREDALEASVPHDARPNVGAWAVGVLSLERHEPSVEARGPLVLHGHVAKLWAEAKTRATRTSEVGECGWGEGWGREARGESVW